MLFKSCALLLVAAALVLAQDQPSTASRDRQRVLANRRTKLIEDAQQQRATPAAVGTRRRLVAKSRVITTEAPTTTTTTTTTTTEAPVTEPALNDFTETLDVPAEEEVPVVEEEIQQVQEELPVFRPRPAIRTQVVEEEPISRPRPAVRVQQEVVEEEPISRPRPALRVQQEVIEEQLEEVQQPVRQRPLAGPTRTRTQSVNRAQSNLQARPQTINRQQPVSRPDTAQEEIIDEERKPFVETTRRYSFVGDDGSFTFGYENADGSFKEETRGVDCIVRGKYGYVDPEGIRREFTYQTGNQCDPNAVPAEVVDEEAELNVPVRRPTIPERTRPTQERRPAVERRPTQERRPVVVQQEERRPVIAQQEETLPVEEEREIEQVLNTPTRINRPVANTRTEQNVPAQRRPTQTRFDEEVQRFSGNTQATRAETSRPESTLSFQPPPFQPRPAGPRPTTTTTERPIFQEEEDVFEQRRPVAQQEQEPRPVLQQEQARPQPPARRPAIEFEQPGAIRTGTRSFTTELIFDPRSNQFQTALQQRIPSTNEDISIREQLIAFVPSTTTTTARPLVGLIDSRVPVAEQPRAEQRPQVPQFIQQEFQPQQRPVFNPFQSNVQDQERIRQDQERRRQQEEEQRLADERQRIAEENERRRLQPAVTFSQGGPRFLPPFQQQQAQPFIPSTSFFGPPRPQPQREQPRTINFQERPTFASGQIDSFLSSLGA